MSNLQNTVFKRPVRVDLRTGHEDGRGDRDQRERKDVSSQNSFFTTKEVGKGTGQGLAIARSVIVNKHGGTLRFETERDQGTTFFVRLPLDAADVKQAA